MHLYLDGESPPVHVAPSDGEALPGIGGARDRPPLQLLDDVDVEGG